MKTSKSAQISFRPNKYKIIIVSYKRFEKSTMDPTSSFFKEGDRRFWLTINIFICSAEAKFKPFLAGIHFEKKNALRRAVSKDLYFV
jgi:hypothetical protein